MMPWRPARGWHEGTDDPTPFIKYLLAVILAAYREFDERMELVEGKRPALEVVRQAAERKLGKFTKADMMEMCPTLSKTSVESSIKKLVDEVSLSNMAAAAPHFIQEPENTGRRHLIRKRVRCLLLSFFNAVLACQAQEPTIMSKDFRLLKDKRGVN